MNNAEKIQMVINTLETIMIPSTFDNVNRMTGIFNTLVEVRDSLENRKKEENTEVTEDG